MLFFEFGCPRDVPAKAGTHPSRLWRDGWATSRREGWPTSFGRRAARQHKEGGTAILAVISRAGSAFLHIGLFSGRSRA